MELNLKMINIDCYNMDLKTTIVEEESAESIVPDNCSDISRIIGAGGIALIRSKDIQNGKVNINGGVKARVIMMPEGESEPVCLEINIPFSAVLEDESLSPESSVHLSCDLSSLEAKMANPRKISVKAEVAIGVEAYSPSVLSICTGVEDAEDYGIQSRSERQLIQIPICVREKSFVLSDVLEIGSDELPAKEVYKSELSLSLSESKLIGSKAVFKGTAGIRLLYLTSDNELSAASFELPFSQLMELDTALEDDICKVMLVPTGCEIAAEDMLGDGSASFNLTLSLAAQAVAIRSESVDIVSDLYSTKYDTDTKKASISFDCLLDRHSILENERLTFEPEERAAEIIDASVILSAVETSRSQDVVTLTAKGRASLIYRDEEGNLRGESRDFTGTARTDLAEECSCFARAALKGEPVPSFAGGGVDLRFDVDYSMESYAKCLSSGVSSVSLTGEYLALADSPSVILKVVQAGEEIWEIARRYKTSEDEIRGANALENDEELSAGKVLLIPKLR